MLSLERIPRFGFEALYLRNFAVPMNFPMLSIMGSPPNSPTPDWGTLGPGSDIKRPESLSADSSPRNTGQRGSRQAQPPLQIMFAVMSLSAALGLFFFFQAKLSDRRADQNLQSSGARPQAQRFSSAAQREAEGLLQRATTGSPETAAQIEANAPRWRGQIKLTPQLTHLVAAGLNANDRRVRAATVQLDLAAMNISEDASSVDRLVKQAESSNHATRIWALWTLGLLANRGIEPGRITEVLTRHLSDADIDSRHWTVEALSYVATDAVMQPLLRTLHDDPSPVIRERAACALAESGMLTTQQRQLAIPTLLAYADDPSLDSATHAWTYHALRDITAQNLPDDAAAWRNWYERNR